MVCPSSLRVIWTGAPVLDDVHIGARSGHKALIMAIPSSFCRCCVYRQEGGFELIHVLSCNASVNNSIKKVICVILM
jgi:hypothetical protein